MKELRGDPEEYIHSSRFAEKLQQYVPSLQVTNSKVGLVLTFKENIGDVLLDACKENADDIAVKLVQVANHMRKEVFDTEYKFHESLTDKQYDNYPKSLLTFVKLILGGNEQERSEEVSNIHYIRHIHCYLHNFLCYQFNFLSCLNFRLALLLLLEIL